MLAEHHEPDASEPEDIDHRYYTAIGRIAAGWAALDWEINRTIWEIAGVDQMPGACIAAQIVSTRGRLAALLSLIELHGGKKKLTEKVEKFTRKSQGLVEEHNRSVHDAWMLRHLDKAVLRLHITAKDKLEFGFRPISLKDLDDVYMKIKAHVRAFAALRKQILAELSPLRDTARRQFRRIDQIDPPQGQNTAR